MTRLSVLFLAGSLAVIPASAQTAAKADHSTHMASPGGAPELRTAMRKLWTDHVVWTRDDIIAAVADAPDAQSAATRLMKNQDDIGNAIATYYGAPAGQQLTTLLKAHISTTVDVIKAAKSGDQSASKLMTRSTTTS